MSRRIPTARSNQNVYLSSGDLFTERPEPIVRESSEINRTVRLVGWSLALITSVTALVSILVALSTGAR